jgi:hypothetical protein
VGAGRAESEPALADTLAPRLRVKVVLFWIPALVHAGAIFYLSSRPRPGDDLPPGTLLAWFYEAVPGADKATHFGMFFLLALLASLAMNRTWPPRSDSRLRAQAVVAFLLATIYAASDEIHQHFVPPRTPDMVDFLADSAGAAAGAALFAHLVLRRERRSRSQAGESASS